MNMNSRDEMFDDWAALLAEARESEAELPGVAPFLATLEGAHAQALGLRSRRDALVASAMEATAQLKEVCAAGRDAASSLRSYIRSMAGPRCEKLVRFGIKPLRKRRPQVVREAPGNCGSLS